jgi:uncharacterized C2H2 Zn-finger protein
LKQSLLQRHQRPLNHHDIFTCNVCQKTFNRKDNLTRYELKQQDGSLFHCNDCGKLFGRKDNLQRHVEQHHNQYGGGAKIPASSDENEEQMRKKRLTAESNPENYYTLRITKEQRIPKFNTTALHYKVDIKNLDVRDLPDIVKTFKMLFQSIISNITEFMQPNGLVRISVQCPELDVPIPLPFVKSNDITVERLLTEIERVLQSYEEFVLDETLEIELVHASLPDGGVGRSGNFVDLERHIKEKSSLIRIQNNDDICCARALVTAKARIDGHQRWSSIRQG